MCWICEHPGSSYRECPDQESVEELRATVHKHGWAVQFAGGRPIDYAYTVGLHGRGLPELLVTGIPPLRATRFLNSAAESFLLGGSPRSGERIVLRVGLLIEIVEVEHPDAHLNAAVAFYGPQVQAIQLVWADDQGRWPWAAGFGNGQGGQPVLGVRSPVD